MAKLNPSLFCILSHLLYMLSLFKRDIYYEEFRSLTSFFISYQGIIVENPRQSNLHPIPWLRILVLKVNLLIGKQKIRKIQVELRTFS